MRGRTLLGAALTGVLLVFPISFIEERPEQQWGRDNLRTLNQSLDFYRLDKSVPSNVSTAPALTVLKSLGYIQYVPQCQSMIFRYHRPAFTPILAGLLYGNSQHVAPDGYGLKNSYRFVAPGYLCTGHGRIDDLDARSQALRPASANLIPTLSWISRFIGIIILSFSIVSFVRELPSSSTYTKSAE